MRDECAQPLLCQSLTLEAGAGTRAEGVAAEGEVMPLIGKGWLGVKIQGKVEADLCQLAAILLWEFEVLARRGCCDDAQ